LVKNLPAIQEILVQFQGQEDLLPEMVTWPDNMDTTKWYYLTVQEASNSHGHERKPNGYEVWTELKEVPDWAALEKVYSTAYSK